MAEALRASSDGDGWRARRAYHHEAQRLLGSFLGALELEPRQVGPPGAQEILARARDCYHQVEPDGSSGSAVLLAINNALSYGHHLLDRLLRARGGAGGGESRLPGFRHLLCRLQQRR
jgi:hypothetical protein